eukprot:4139096-Ditylum_brightwellii.AAC.1
MTPSIAIYLKDKDEALHKKEKEKSTQHRSKKAKKKLEDIQEENRCVIKDAAKHKTYIVIPLMTGEEEIT